MRVAGFNEPALELVLDLEAVLPGIRPAGIRILPIYSQPEVGEWAER